MLGDGRPDADRLEQVLGGRGQREGARVGARATLATRSMSAILKLGPERIAQRARQGEPGEARAGDCDIEAGGLLRHVASGHLR